MNKSFLVAGATWTATVTVEYVENYATDDDLRIEAATQAVEALYGKREGVEIHKHNFTITDNSSEYTQILCALINTEIEPNCGIGAVLVIKNQDDEITNKDEDNEWYISSKIILNNAGFPKLATKFDAKFPTPS